MKHPWLVLLAVGIGLLEAGTACLEGQDNGASAAPIATPAPSAPTQFTVLASRTVQVGNHRVTYNRVAPPPLPAATPAPATSQAAALTRQIPQALQQLQARQQQTWVNFIVSATVFNVQLSEITWSINDATYHGYSNIDFTVLGGLTQFTAGDTVYSLMVLPTALGANPHAPAALAAPSVPGLPAQTPTQSAYVVDSRNGQTPPPAALTAMDSLHAYFDANRDAIIAAHTQQVAQAAAQAQWAKDHPPVPQDIVINYWPIGNQTSNNANNQK